MYARITFLVINDVSVKQADAQNSKLIIPV